MTLRAFLFGPSPWRGAPAVGAILAVAAAVGVFIAGNYAATVVVQALYGGNVAVSQPYGATFAGESALMALMIWLLCAQGAMIAGTLGVAGAVSDDVAKLLRLGPPAGGAWAYVWGVVALATVAAAISLVLWLARPDSLLQDLQLYLQLVRSEAVGVAAVVVGVGAPLSEELMFRGLLLPALAATRLGFLGGTLISTALWTALHWGYSITGLIEVALFGLVLSWLLWRTGSLRVPLFCHALYNSLLLLALWLFAPAA